MYTVHIANKNYSSWSLRPWVLIRELAIPFEEKNWHEKEMLQYGRVKEDLWTA